MGRLANIQKAGYYPFPPEHYSAVAAQLSTIRHSPFAIRSTWMLDPCAGTAHFAHYLATHLGLKLATIEINAERGLDCRKLAHHHVTSDALQVEIHKAQFSFLWSNPPFMKDHELRLEWKFLRRFLEALAPGGILAYTIPQATMTQDHHILRHLVEFYEDHRLYYLPDPNPYRQIVLFARKRAERVKLGKAGTGELLTTLMSPPLLPDACDDPLQIPAHPRPSIVLRGTHVDWDELRAEAAASPGPDLGELMAHPGIIEGTCPGRQVQGRSLMPPRRGHVASLMAGGGLDNTFLPSPKAGVGNEIVKGYVQRIEAQQKLTEEQKLARVTELIRTEYEPMITRFNPTTGQFHVHTSQNGLGDFLATNAAALSQVLIETLDPAYDFDLDAQPDYAQYILENMAKHMQIPGKPAGLWPGQRHVGAALDTAFRSSPSPSQGEGRGEGRTGLGLKGTILVAEMGWGKTLEAAAQFALYYHRLPPDACRSPKPSWAITEPHLVDEMAETIKSCYPKALVTIVTDIAQVQRFIRLKDDPVLGQQPRIAVLSKELFKGGSGFRSAVITDRRHFHGHVDDENKPLLAFRCPDCGRVQVISHNCKLGDAGTTIHTIAYFRQRPRRCCYDVITTQDGHTKRLGCGAPLYQQARAIGTTGIYAGVGQDGFKGLSSLSSFSIFTPSRPGLVRMPIADYIARLHPDQVGLVLWDEAHTAKGESTDTGHALAAIALVADHVLLMTGTLFGGTASSVFHLAYRISPHFRKRWRWNQLQAFVERYGVLEKKTVQREVPDSRGSATTKTRIITHVRELPGCSPALVSLFLGFTIFTGLGDLGISLPPLKRRIIHADPDPDHAQAYERYADACKEEMRHQKENDVDLSGSFLHTLRGHAVAPWRPEYLKQKIVRPMGGRMRHTYTRVYLTTNSLEWTCPQCARTFPNPTTLQDENRLRCHHCYPITADGNQACQDTPLRPASCILPRPRLFSAEQALIDELLTQKERGRRCLVFVCQTDTRDVTPRLQALCEQHGLKVRRCDVAPRKRRKWFEQYGPFLDAVLVNPEAVKTGLNLTMFATAIWFEIPYSLYTIKQAGARIRRPTSQADVIEEIFIDVPGTIVEDALSLVFEKLTAAAIFRGESASQALMTVRGSGSFTADLIDRVMKGTQGKVNDLDTLFARYNQEDQISEQITVTPTVPADTQPIQQVVAEYQRQAAQTANWVATQLSLF